MDKKGRKFRVTLEELIQDVEKYQAHTRIKQDGRIVRESLSDHTELTLKYFQTIWKRKLADVMLENYIQIMWGALSEEAEDFLKEMITGIPVFHDCGKINSQYQREILQNTNVKEDTVFSCVKSKHSLISAILYLDYFDQKLKERVEKKEEREKLRPLAIFHSYLISRHHTDLCDFKEFVKELLVGQGQELMKIFRQEGKSVYKPTFTLSEGKIGHMTGELEKSRKACSWEKCIAVYAYVRVLYSMLVAADYYATTEFMSGKEMKDLGSLEEIQEWVRVYEETDLMHSIREYQKNRYPQTEETLKQEKNINILRTEMLCDAEKKLEENAACSLFYLEAPTGSGKSNTAMDLSLRFVDKDKTLQKIFYIYPFNTLVEQNVKNLEKIFGDEQEIFQNIAIVNSLTPIKDLEKEKQEEQTESTYHYQKALLDRQFLNYPVIISTHVSLFDTMFSDTKESAFAFHQLMNSVIVLDEIQSYKNELWGEITYFLKVFAKMLHIRIIIMSATLPNLDLLTEDVCHTVKLIENRKKYFTNPCFKKRVSISYELLDYTIDKEKTEIFDILIAHMKTFIPKRKKILVEFIKKDSAYQFFRKLRDEQVFLCDIEYMSGDDSIAERGRILSKIQNAQNSMVLVATQVIEAGVDLDMDVGYKNISKLDSEEQFLGRINRSCLRDGKVFFFQLDNGLGIYRGDIRIQKRYTLDNEEIRKILLDKDFEKYYERILAELKKNRNENTGEIGLEEFFCQNVGGLMWGTVKERMRLIPDDTWSMQVYLARQIKDCNGNIIDGKSTWENYRELLNDFSMPYAEKRVKLSEITSKMNYFIYQIKRNPDLCYHDKIGEIFYIEEGEKYFVEGKIDRKKLQGEVGKFVDFI